MQPRPVFPGSTYLMTRRCAQRQFLFRPDERANQTAVYCLAYAAAETGVQIHAYVFLSNHYHMVVTDPGGKIVEFTHRLNLLLARSLNALRNRRDSVFDCSQASRVRAAEAGDVLRQLVYTFCNPVSSGLVADARDWPGARSDPSQFDTTIPATKPGWFFSAKMPNVIALELTRPPCFLERSREEFMEELTEEVREREANCRAEIESSNQAFLGRRRALKQDPEGSPRTYAKRWTISPTVQAQRPKARVEELVALKTFRLRYREALVQYRNRIKDVVFPAGTYWMRVFHLQRCEPLISGAVPAGP